jgi:hypothetical protein
MLRHGFIKLNDYCVLIVVIPFCRFGGKIQHNGEFYSNGWTTRERRILDVDPSVWAAKRSISRPLTEALFLLVVGWTHTKISIEQRRLVRHQ